MDCLSGAKYFNKIDLKIGYHCWHYFGRPGSNPLLVKKTQDIGPTKQDSVDNAYDADEVSPEISYGDYKNQVSIVMSRISLLQYY